MKKYLFPILGLVIGGVVGLSYWYFSGCADGSCSLQSNWYLPTGFGMVSGLIIAWAPPKKEK